ncbi:hypothetical protein DFH09DRAFT_1331131 [Mycena vulgaris]|nr:hypothetical protein DFH09DRAFT_1331131 [Mycena vulgaris]
MFNLLLTLSLAFGLLSLMLHLVPPVPLTLHRLPLELGLFKLTPGPRNSVPLTLSRLGFIINLNVIVLVVSFSKHVFVLIEFRISPGEGRAHFNTRRQRRNSSSPMKRGVATP